MDNTETHYVTYDAEELWDEIQDAHIESGGDILYPSDEKEILLRTVQAIAISIMAKCDSAMRMDTRQYAQEEYLDIYGDKRNCARIEATAATATVEIVFRANGYAQTIPAGTELTADGVVLYHLTEDIEQTGAAQTITTTIECSTAGTVGNGLLNNKQMQFIQTNDAIVSIYTTSAATGGQDDEDDEDYRERIGVQGLTTVTTGPSDQYEAAAEAVSSLILDAKAMNDDPGEVGIYMILDSGASSAGMIQAVQEALNPKNVRPLNDKVYVYVAEAVAYTLHVSVWYPSGLNIEDQIAEAIAEYKDWQENTVGRAFNPGKLTAALYQLGATRVEYADDDGINGAGAKYTEIAERKHCVGTITPNLVVES